MLTSALPALLPSLEPVGLRLWQTVGGVGKQQRARVTAGDHAALSSVRATPFLSPSCDALEAVWLRA